MTKKQIKELRRILLAVLILAGAVLCDSMQDMPKFLAVFMYMAAYVSIGLETVLKALRNIFRGQVFDECFLMSVATVGAIFLGEFTEANAVMIFYQIGELFEDIAVDKSRKSIAELMDIRPDYANVIRGDEEVTLDPYDVQIGDVIIVKPGEKIPMDGRIIEGKTSVDTAALTGEAEPRDAEIDDEVISGCINLSGVIKVQVTKEFSESTVSKILDLVENASSKKANVEKFITRFARVYTPAVCIAAVVLAVLPPLVLPGAKFSVWIYRALSFLVISCPCALVLSVPLAFFGGVGGAGKVGILIKGSNYLEALARMETVVFDKTGTLTTGAFDIERIVTEGDYEEDVLLEIAAYAESYSSHPVGMAIVHEYGLGIDFGKVIDVKEAAGRGVETSFMYLDREITVHAGNEKLMWEIGLYDVPPVEETCVYVAVDGDFAGYITFADRIKSDARELVGSLKKLGIDKTVMLTGDRENIAEKVGDELEIGTVYAELLPQDKVSKVEELIDIKSEKKSVVFVGDGINDAPVLARADVGIAMGGLGSDAAIEAADIVIMTDEPSKLISAVKIAKKTTGIARQNVVFALAVKLGVLGLTALGFASMWAAIFADVGVAVLCILHSMRALNIKNL
ncbi:MAG: heavy metal translocating P-type ATPase [Firmicutes bacterium]|nr:heavy metal translocating P-type ATPase [Bacillota bacterium]